MEPLDFIIAASTGGAISLFTSILVNKVYYSRQSKKERENYLLRFYDKVSPLCRVDYFDDSPVILYKSTEIVLGNTNELLQSLETVSLFDFFNLKNETKIIDKVKENLIKLRHDLSNLDLNDNENNFTQQYKIAKKIKDDLESVKQSMFKKVNKEIRKL